MKLIKGLLNYAIPWAVPNIYLFTGNPIVKANGAIVMGRGAAKQVRDTFPGIDVVFGSQLKLRPLVSLVWLKGAEHQYIGWFKVKEHWKLPADRSAIAASANALAIIAAAHADRVFHMNYPGVGNGKLTEADVSPYLEILPDNVLIYR
jgi:hypothetical protein